MVLIYSSDLQKLFEKHILLRIIFAIVWMLMVWIVVICCYTWCHCSSPPVGNSWADRVKGISCPVSPEVTRETTPQMGEHPVLPEPRVLSPVPSSLTESLDSFRETNGKILIVAIVFFLSDNEQCSKLDECIDTHSKMILLPSVIF